MESDNPGADFDNTLHSVSVLEADWVESGYKREGYVALYEGVA